MVARSGRGLREIRQGSRAGRYFFRRPVAGRGPFDSSTQSCCAAWTASASAFARSAIFDRLHQRIGRPAVAPYCASTKRRGVVSVLLGMGHSSGHGERPQQTDHQRARFRRERQMRSMRHGPEAIRGSRAPEMHGHPARALAHSGLVQCARPSDVMCAEGADRYQRLANVPGPRRPS